jgi:hypothetical protein
MNASVNGSPEIKVSIINTNPGFRFVFCTSEGGYIGAINADFMTSDGLKLMASKLPELVAQMMSGIAIAGQLPPGLQAPRGN